MLVEQKRYCRWGWGKHVHSCTVYANDHVKCKEETKVPRIAHWREPGAGIAWFLRFKLVHSSACSLHTATELLASQSKLSRWIFTECAKSIKAVREAD